MAMATWQEVNIRRNNGMIFGLGLIFGWSNCDQLSQFQVLSYFSQSSIRRPFRPPPLHRLLSLSFD